MTTFEENIIKSICKQGENLSKHSHIYCKEAANLYDRIIDVQILALSGKIDTIKAIKLLKEAKELNK